MNIKTFQKVFAEEWKKYKTSLETESENLEKLQRNTKPPTFEEDPIEFILYSYPTLKDTLKELLSPNFLDYITGIYVIAPVPTTFKVILHNNQYFYMIYMGKSWIAKVSGKKYYLLNVGERGRAVVQIARLLAMGAPPNIEPSQSAVENQTTETTNDIGDFGGETEEIETETEETLAESVKSKKNLLLEIGKKYPQAFRILVKQALILEGTFNQNSKKVVQNILDSPQNKEYGFTPMSKPGRVANLKNVESEKFKDLLHSLYPETEIKSIPPRVSPNPSGRFIMYTLDTEDGPAGVILASGMNKGEKYEKDFVNSMKDNAGKPSDQVDNPEIIELYKALGIKNEDLTPDQINQTGIGNNKRQISFKGPEDVGEIIADITISPDTYLSIKDPKGTGIYNGGRLKFIKEKEDGNIYFDEDTYNSEISITKEIFDTLNLDPEQIASGLNDYIDKTGTPSQWQEITDFDNKLLHHLLASAYGYGYWYVRKMKNGDLKIVNIDTPEKAYDMVGDVESIKVKYPGVSTKAGEIRIKTNSPLMGENVYIIDMRNAGGKILPSIKIKTLK